MTVANWGPSHPAYPLPLVDLPKSGGPDPAVLLDLADKAARVRGGPFPVTPDLDAALRALQDRIAARLAEVLA